MKLAALGCFCQKQLCRSSPGPLWIDTCLRITFTNQTAALLLATLTTSAQNEKLLQALLSLHSVIKGKASIPNWRVLLEGMARRTSSRSR